MSARRPKTAPRARDGQAAVRDARRAPQSRTPWIVAALVVVVLVGLFAIYRANAGGGGPASDRYDVGSPGIGAMAPDFALPNVTTPGAGGSYPTIRLSDYRGKTVLLYFHEGLGCQPCWDQIRDLQHNPAALRAMGVDQLLPITSGPPDLVAQKMSDDGLTGPALVDPALQVSTRYQANRYGMMGASRDGHSFVLVGPDGTIDWRADYGGPPKFTMYVAPDQLTADLRAGRQGS